MNFGTILRAFLLYLHRRVDNRRHGNIFVRNTSKRIVRDIRRNVHHVGRQFALRASFAQSSRRAFFTREGTRGIGTTELRAKNFFLIVIRGFVQKQALPRVGEGFKLTLYTRNQHSRRRHIIAVLQLVERPRLRTITKITLFLTMGEHIVERKLTTGNVIRRVGYVIKTVNLSNRVKIRGRDGRGWAFLYPANAVGVFTYSVLDKST